MHRLNSLHTRISHCLLQDRRKFAQRLYLFKNHAKSGVLNEQKLNKLVQEVETSHATVAQRKKPVSIEYPDLPVSSRRAEIVSTIKDNQVVIVCGETGSGKTTQLPKMCLEAGLGVYGRIGHTQPRRIAAYTVATRIAQELRSELGQQVSFKVRFSKTGEQTSRIKVMTDGILLAEVQSDPSLNQYDCLILDEAHERSLNIDFLLGYLKQLLPRRPDLKLIITSATIDSERFSKHFNNAPTLHVEGRTYPVEVQYQDPALANLNTSQAIFEAIHSCKSNGRGDILVFLPTERDIRETAKYLDKSLQGFEIVPLFSRLSNSEQQRIFRASNGQRIVLSTNVAETSLTVPGIRYVIDTGTARISRYSTRAKVQRLPIEPVSQAAANQRKGRCGRIEAGLCIRLYSEDDFLSRPEFTDPEIKRTNLASVILQMEVLKLGHIDDFPFIEPPTPSQVRAGYRLLFEIGAIDELNELTQLGKQIARLPIDPQLGRVLIAAHRYGCLREALIVVAFLSIQDPRERPLEKQTQADSKHARFIDEKSDFIAIVNLWDWFRAEAQSLSQNKLRKLCSEDFLAFARMREWKEIHLQLLMQLKSQNINSNQPSPAPFKIGDEKHNKARGLPYDKLHRALLSGLISHVGLREELDKKAQRKAQKQKRKPLQPYSSARSLKFFLFPGSFVAKKAPKWVLASELVETSALFARGIAQINPAWIEEIAPHLIKREYFDIHFQTEGGHIGAKEKVSIFNLILSSGRIINYGPINPPLAREVFIREGLVEGALQTNLAFFTHNQKCIHEVRLLEAKSRRPDLLVDEQILFAFYDKHLPANIYNLPLLKKWLKNQPDNTLFFDGEKLLARDTDHVDEVRFPSQLVFDDFALPLQYAHAPGQDHDGLTLHIPLPALGQVSLERGRWMVAGLLEEKITELIRALPKALRRNFVPVPNYAQAVTHALICEHDGDELLPKVSHQLLRMTGVNVPENMWNEAALPKHLQLRYCVLDVSGEVIECARDLASLQKNLNQQAEQALTHAPTKKHAPASSETYAAWTFDNLVFEHETTHMGLSLKRYAALVPKDSGVHIQYFDTIEKAINAHQAGLAALFDNALKPWFKQFNWQQVDKTCLLYSRVKHCPEHLKPQNSNCEQFKADLRRATINRLCLFDAPHILTKADFEVRRQVAQGEIHKALTRLNTELNDSLQHYFDLHKKLKHVPLPLFETAQDIQQQIDTLVYIGFAAHTANRQLKRLPVYLKAAQIRLDKALADPAKDRRGLVEIKTLNEKIITLPEHIKMTPAYDELLQMVQELRISLFAQPMKTAFPTSSKRILAAISQINA